jgi:hypothetical protein
LLVSVKKVSYEPPSAMSLAAGSGMPSIPRPCSRRYLERSVSRPRAGGKKGGENSQLPCAVAQLGTSLADVDVKNLFTGKSASSLSLVYREVHLVLCSGSQ